MHVKLQVDTPLLQFAIPDTKVERKIRVCQYIALLLSHRGDGSEVTAVTENINLKSDPIQFEFIFSKNRDQHSPQDSNRATELAYLIRKGMSEGKSSLMGLLCDYTLAYSSHTHVQQGKRILELTPPLLTHLGRMIKSMTPQVWQFDHVHRNEADRLLAQVAKDNTCSPLDVLLSMLTVMVRISHQLQPHDDHEQHQQVVPPKGEDLLTMGKYSHLLLQSTIFPGFVERIRGLHSQVMAVDLWQSLRILEMFFTSCSLLYDELNALEFRPFVDRLMIIPATPLSYIDYAGISKKYKIKTNEAWQSPTVGPMLPVGDFWEFVQARTKHTSQPLNSLRYDWLKNHPQLFKWDGLIVASQTVHAEVKLALNCLNRRIRGQISIGVSKQPCFCCERFFDAWNAQSKRTHFHLAPGHKKVYPGWSPSGLHPIDQKVVEGVWEVVDKIIAEVKHIESKDLVAAAPWDTQKVLFGAFELSKLSQLIHDWNEKG